MTTKQIFNERVSLINRAIRCEPVDKIPLIWQGTAVAPIQMGITMEEFSYEPQKAVKSQLDYMDKLHVDGCNTILWYRPDVALPTTWLSRIKMPGKELSADVVWQVDEQEQMTVEDYDMILNQGYDAFLGQFLPKIVDMNTFQEGAAQMEKFTPWMVKTMVDRGYPSVASAMTTTPFETLCGGRSMMKFYVDLYQIPDKVKAVMDLMVPMYIGMALDSLQHGNGGIRGTWVGGWRTASGLLAPKLWDKFVFPYIATVVNALAEKDVVCVLHLDQNWSRDLARFKELPPKKCVMNLDGMTDIRKAKEILGDDMAILGDVPPQLLAASTPDKVYAYVENLIKDIGKTGLLLCPGCDAPINAKHDNIVAMYEAGRDFG